MGPDTAGSTETAVHMRTWANRTARSALVETWTYRNFQAVSWIVPTGRFDVACAYVVRTLTTAGVLARVAYLNLKRLQAPQGQSSQAPAGAGPRPRPPGFLVCATFVNGSDLGEAAIRLLVPPEPRRRPGAGRADRRHTRRHLPTQS